MRRGAPCAGPVALQPPPQILHKRHFRRVPLHRVLFVPPARCRVLSHHQFSREYRFKKNHRKYIIYEFLRHRIITRQHADRSHAGFSTSMFLSQLQGTTGDRRWVPNVKSQFVQYLSSGFLVWEIWRRSIEHYCLMIFTSVLPGFISRTNITKESLCKIYVRCDHFQNFRTARFIISFISL